MKKLIIAIIISNLIFMSCQMNPDDTEDYVATTQQTVSKVSISDCDYVYDYLGNKYAVEPFEYEGNTYYNLRMQIKYDEFGAEIWPEGTKFDEFGGVIIPGDKLYTEDGKEVIR